MVEVYPGRYVPVSDVTAWDPDLPGRPLAWHTDEPAEARERAARMESLRSTRGRANQLVIAAFDPWGRRSTPTNVPPEWLVPEDESDGRGAVDPVRTSSPDAAPEVATSRPELPELDPRAERDRVRADAVQRIDRKAF